MDDWDKNYRLASMVGRNPEIVRDAANAEIERLRAALRDIADLSSDWATGGRRGEGAEIERLRSALILIRRAIEHLPADTIIARIDGLANTALEGEE